MDVFQFRKAIIRDYETFSRSFTRIRAPDIQRFADETYQDGRFWPAPLIQLNPSFVAGRTVEDLVRDGVLDEQCAAIFRAGKGQGNAGVSLRLHRHQEEALLAAQRNTAYVLTTGTGSGKSLAYFVPIVDAVLKERRTGAAPGRIRAIVIYPMNALCNSQYEELAKFLGEGYGPGREPVTFGRYTGQETQEEHDRVANNPPDILLTNFMMLELLVTRQDDRDRSIMKAAQGLRFLVLDELHTYRGRQGADVALLVRRVRERLNSELLCVGTSATMASEGNAASRRAVVASVAARLFGAAVTPESVITETLERVTADVALDASRLREGLGVGWPKHASYSVLREHPLAAWVESRMGLQREEDKWVRAKPRTIEDAARLLAEESGVPLDKCRETLERFLLAAYEVRDGEGRRLFTFRLHQFISGAGSLYMTLEPEGARYLTVEGQQYQPGERDKRLFNVVFCRECGQEYLPVWAQASGNTMESFDPRELGETRSDDDEARWGFFMPDPHRQWNPEDRETAFPEEWLEIRKSEVTIKSSYKRYVPRAVSVDTQGQADEEGLEGWFIPGSFKFCLNLDCGAYFSGRVGEMSKLSTLSTEGRSSATTTLTLSALRYLLEEADDLSPQARKLLGFTDNRQDASLQAGHFNDFRQILMLRGALVAAAKAAPEGYLTDDILTQSVARALGLQPDDYASNPEAMGSAKRNSEQTLRDVLGYRLYRDLRRGWRVTNPNLEQLGLLRIEYLGLDDGCADDSLWAETDARLAVASPDVRLKIARELLEVLRRALCIKTVYLDDARQESIRLASANVLKEPWGFSEDEQRLEPGLFMVLAPRPSGRPLERAYYLSARSRFGRWLRAPSTWRGENGALPAGRVSESEYDRLVGDLLRVLTRLGIIEPQDIARGVVGYRVNAAALQWFAVEEASGEGIAPKNRFFEALYRNVAHSLDVNNRFLHHLEAREHTAQVESEIREEREAAFRTAKLPVLFCSPTMELGVDIAALNTVYMRNVPPTPANYAQRSGRAGRSGQAALVVTYCAAKSPHDQYFFADPARMVAGVVSPPALDLANEDLVRSHLHAVWLAETGLRLAPALTGLMDMTQRELPLQPQVVTGMESESVRARASRRAVAILGMLAQELTPASAPWYQGDWLDRTLRRAHLDFDAALNRWRGLYQATVRQMESAHTTQMNAAASERERDEAKSRYNEAVTQQRLLLSPAAATTSDFSTYRYLASQGFLPGYNFPRLPLLAYIPARRERIGREAFLSRPRFLALSEFGPRSIIYHEGSQYRVERLIIGIREQDGILAGQGLPVRAARLCSACGYAHFEDSLAAELCLSCGESLTTALQLSTLYRVENVSTRRIMRITSDEEERLRQGYEMQTTFQFAREDGHWQVTETELSEAGDTLFRLQYAPAATVWRLNLGWRRRRNKTIYGFVVDTTRGTWSKDTEAPEEVGDADPAVAAIQRIIPFVEDHRNVLILTPTEGLDAKDMTTLQYALKRGIEAVFQLEENELVAEPLPGKDARRHILFFESAEGGAGVLTRLAGSSEALQRVARRALEICHFDLPQGRLEADSLIDTAGPGTPNACEAGCYRCLLSYYNQPEHVLIDRRSEVVKSLLCRLARVTLRTGTQGRSPEAHLAELTRRSNSSLEQAWLDFVKEADLRLPDRAQPLLAEYHTQPDFAYSQSQALIYIDGPHHDGQSQKQLDKNVTERLEDAGFTVIRFPKERGAWRAIAQRYVDVFGAGRS